MFKFKVNTNYHELSKNLGLMLNCKGVKQFKTE